jgi:hypothetical protein
VCQQIRRALEYYLGFCRDEGVRAIPPSQDVIIESLEEYRERAEARAVKRAEGREEKGLAPIESDRKGATMPKDILAGYKNLSKVLGLPFEKVCDSKAVKSVAAAAAGMPRVQPMLSMVTIEAYERTTRDPSASAFDRAYAGGGWLQVPSRLRVKDMQRTPEVTVRYTECFGDRFQVATGTAARSKAPSQAQMRPLPWRAPLIPMSSDDRVDLDPLFDSMPQSSNGCVFRAFACDQGAAGAKDIEHAVEWLDRAATHDEVCNALTSVARRAYVRYGLTPPEDDVVGGHMGRHNVPESGRLIKLPKASRERLGYWRAQPAISDSTEDSQAVERALTIARQRKQRMGRIADCADRYSSVDAAPLEMDEEVTACLLAIKGAFDKFKAEGVPIPPRTADQAAAIKSQHDAALRHAFKAQPRSPPKRPASSSPQASAKKRLRTCLSSSPSLAKLVAYARSPKGRKKMAARRAAAAEAAASD